jgi:hypothetical protein
MILGQPLQIIAQSTKKMSLEEMLDVPVSSTIDGAMMDVCSDDELGDEDA